MPLPVAVAIAARVAARRAALSAARKRAIKSRKKLARFQGGSGKESKRNISWAEIALVVFFVALPNDILDVINLTGVGKLVTIFIEPITLSLLFFWFWFRVREGAPRKILKNLLTFVAEIIPVVGLFPLWTLLVINAKTGWFDWIFAIPEKLLPFSGKK